MPFQQRELVQFGILMLCVPLQFYLSGYFENVKEVDRSKIIISTMKSVEQFKEVLNVKFWFEKWQECVLWIITDIIGFELDGEGESAAVEVIEYRHQHGLPTEYSKVHKHRPAYVFYRIGQVVQHDIYAYRGVIVGWEYTNKDAEPIYTVLIDESHLKEGMMSSSMEVEQNKLFILKSKEIKHRHMKRYFSAYDGSQYIPQNWLRKIYPRD